LGTFQLFLVPAGSDDNGAQGYLATINRLSYADALIPAPKPATRRSETTTTAPATSPANSSPATTQPAQTSTPATIPGATPAEKPKPARKKKPSWKSNDDDFEIN
jgi:hypothetical protein